jgi:hypothetical protein
MSARPAKADLRPTPTLPQPEFAKSLGVDLEAEGQAVAKRLGPIAIRTPTQLAQAALDRQDLGERLKRIDEFFAPFCDLAYKLHRALTARRAEIKMPLEAVDLKLRNAIAAYKAEEDRRRREQEAQLAEIRRQEEEARLLAEAALLESAGDHVLAAAVLETAETAIAPVVVLPDTTKVDGLSFRREWKWRWLHNDRERALQLLPRDYLCPDEQRISKVVAALKDCARIPGVEVFYEDLPIRGRR